MSKRRPPVYLEIVSDLEGKIARGLLPEGFQLPAESHLAEEYGVSRASVRQALLTLELKGLVSRQHGRGTYVKAMGTRQVRGELEQLEDLRELLRRWGYDARDRLLGVSLQPCPSDEADLLDINEQAPCYTMESVKVTPEERLAYCRDVVPVARVKGLDLARVQEERSRVESLLVFWQRVGVEYDYALCSLKVVSSDAELNRILGLEHASPLLRMTGIIYDHRHVPLSFSQLLFRSDVMEFYFVRR